jgi:predicted nucleotidyltransferase
MNAMAHTRLALTDDQRALLRSILDATVPGAKVVVFGSRATGRARPFSDVDLLVLEPQRLTWQQRTALLDALEASVLPFRVDVVEAADLPDRMRTRIEAEAVAL